MKKKVLLIGGGVLVLAVLIGLNLRSSGGKKVTVEVSAVERRDISKVITASGSIQPRRRINVSASAIGKVTEIAVKEGDVVQEGDFLLQIDDAPYASAVEQLSAAVRGARATLELEAANLKKAEYDFERAEQLADKGFTSEETLRDALVGLDVATARKKAAAETLAQQSASLKKAHHDLELLHITAEMSGVITALNVEQGESAIMGTMNNPGTILLTISDLSEMEAEVEVDETEVVLVSVGQPARVRLDAFPDTTFAGIVSEVGNSAVRSSIGMGQQSVDFKVIVTIQDEIPHIRPGLSASVDITVADAYDALTIPIQCLTVRNESKLGRHNRSSPDTTESSIAVKKRDLEGVFLVEGGTVTFRRVRVGIAGESHFVVESGLAEGDEVVSGPFTAINTLRDGDAIKRARKNDNKK